MSRSVVRGGTYRRALSGVAAFAVASSLLGSGVAFADDTPGAAPENDPGANQVLTLDGTMSPDDLNGVLQGLEDRIENNTLVQSMDTLGDATGVQAGQVKELDGAFGGWTPINNGKFTIARKTDKGVFPVETVNVTRGGGKEGGKEELFIQESSFDRSSSYVLLLSKVRTGANSDEPAVNNQPYKNSGESNEFAAGVTGFNGIQKTFKAHSPNTGSNAVVSFKTGYTGDISGTKAQYKVEVFQGKDANDANKLYSVSFDPQNNATTTDYTVVAAKDGSGRQIDVTGKTKPEVEEILAANAPNGTGGLFTSREIAIPKDVTDYTVRVSSADDMHLGMSYQSKHLLYALPMTGVDFSVSQDTKAAAKLVLQKLYDTLVASKDADTKRMTAESVTAYTANLDTLKTLLAQTALSSTADYKSAGTDILTAKNNLVPAEKLAIEKITEAASNKADAIKALDLSEAEKDAALKLVDAEKVSALKAVKDAPDTAGIIAAQNSGLTKIAAINPVGHEVAKKAIADALAQKKNEITKNSSLSEADKKAAIGQAEKIAAEQTKLIDDQPTTAGSAEEAKKAQEAIDAARAAALDGIAKINPVGHEVAKKAIADALAQKKNEITKNSSLSEADKKAAIGQAEKIAAEQTKLIDDQPTTAGSAEEAKKAQEAIDAARAAALDGIAKINPVGHEVAKKAIADALAQKKNEITKNSSLSEADKKAAIGQAEKIAAEQTKLIDDQPTTAGSAEEAKKAQEAIDAARAAALDGIAKINPVGHEVAKKAIADALAQKKNEITKNSSLSEADKKAAIGQAEKIAAEQTKLIDDQPTTAGSAEEAKKAQEAIDAARAAALDGIAKINPVGHEVAKKAIADALAQKKNEITKNSSLSEADKKAAIGQAEKIAAEQTKLIDDQPTTAGSAEEAKKAQEAIDAARAAALDGIAKINPVGHEVAKKAIADALAQKKNEITKNSSLSEADKKAAIGQAEKIAAEQTKLIDDQPTTAGSAEEAKKAQEAIDAARAAALDGIAKINPVGHEVAKKAIADALAQKKNEITKNSSLSEADKKAAIGQAEKIAAEQTKLIDDQPTTAGSAEEAKKAQEAIDAARAAALDGIAKINPVGHEVAKKAIADALAQKKNEITKNSSLSEADKKAAIGQAEKIAAEQTKLIDDQPTTAGSAEEAKKAQEAIDAARAAALDGINKINPVGHEVAKKAIADALAQKKNEITKNSSLSEAEKKAAIGQAEKIAAEQTKLIDDQPTTAGSAEEAKKAQEAIDAARAAALDGINKINPVGHGNAKASGVKKLAVTGSALGATGLLAGLLLAGGVVARRRSAR